jgi:phosphatidylinositol alpha-1,6-mannosyltransferase
LVVTPDFPPATGGIQRLIGELVGRVAWNSLVITLGHPDAADATPTHRVKTIGPGRRLSIALLNVAALFQGSRWRPDAILSCHVAVSPGCIALGRMLGVPVLQYVYAKEITDRADLARFAVRRAATTIAISHHTAALAARAGADKCRILTIEPGVESTLHREPRNKVQRPTILTVARLTDRYKGFDVMLRALPLVRSRIPSAQWIVVGDGGLRAELEAAVVATDLRDAVRFTGTVSDADRDARFQRAHVFAMPSRVPADGGGEGYGLVYLEAGAHGLPCVASDSGAAAEAVVDGETGVLVDARDHVALADALVELLGDPTRAARLGAAGRARAQMLSWDRMTREVETCVAQTIARWPSR